MTICKIDEEEKWFLFLLNFLDRNRLRNKSFIFLGWSSLWKWCWIMYLSIILWILQNMFMSSNSGKQYLLFIHLEKLKISLFWNENRVHIQWLFQWISHQLFPKEIIEQIFVLHQQLDKQVVLISQTSFSIKFFFFKWFSSEKKTKYFFSFSNKIHRESFLICYFEGKTNEMEKINDE